MLLELSDEHRKDKGDGCSQHPYQHERCADRKCLLLHTYLGKHDSLEENT